MNGIYYFNGKDITMNMCIQIRDVIDIIKEKSHLSFPDAALAFYQSQTYQALQNTENTLISQTGSMKSRSKKNYRQTKDVSTMFKKGTTYQIGGSFFYCAERSNKCTHYTKY